MLTLMLMRHAKSSWQEEMDDHLRPLNARGRRDAPRMGRLLAEENLVPDVIVASTAMRARETATLLAEASGFEGPLTFFEDLYHAEPQTLSAVAAQQNDQNTRQLIVAHNPGLEEWVGQLSERWERFPTAALAVFEMPIDRWRQLDEQSRGDLTRLWRPKEI
ncbi:MAG: histidine phosphatase family protein [Phycisphaeraceae bacterium]|nr:histidine phosphatase family protein [Phycisphaeraceae bacterium]